MPMRPVAPLVWGERYYTVWSRSAPLSRPVGILHGAVAFHSSTCAELPHPAIDIAMPGDRRGRRNELPSRGRNARRRGLYARRRGLPSRGGVVVFPCPRILTVRSLHVRLTPDSPNPAHYSGSASNVQSKEHAPQMLNRESLRLLNVSALRTGARWVKKPAGKSISCRKGPAECVGRNFSRLARTCGVRLRKTDTLSLLNRAPGANRVSCVAERRNQWRSIVSVGAAAVSVDC